MRKLVMAMDIDNTIADTNKVLVESGFLPDIPTSYPTPGVDQIIFKENPWIFDCCPTVKGSVKAVNYLSRFWEIVYVTARPKWAEEISWQWLLRHGFPEGEIYCTINKSRVVKHLGISLAVDDSPEEIISLSRIVPVSIYRQPYNKNLAGNHFSWTDFNWGEHFKLLSAAQ